MKCIAPCVVVVTHGQLTLVCTSRNTKKAAACVQNTTEVLDTHQVKTICCCCFNYANVCKWLQGNWAFIISAFFLLLFFIIEDFFLPFTALPMFLSFFCLSFLLFLLCLSVCLSVCLSLSLSLLLFTVVFSCIRHCLLGYMQHLK